MNSATSYYITAKCRLAFKIACTFSVLLLCSSVLLGVAFWPRIAESSPGADTQERFQLSDNRKRYQKALDYVKSVLEEKDQFEANKNKKNDDNSENKEKSKDDIEDDIEKVETERTQKRAIKAEESVATKSKGNFPKVRVGRVKRNPQMQRALPSRFLKAETGSRHDINIVSVNKGSEKIKNSTRVTTVSTTRKNKHIQESDAYSEGVRVKNARDYLAQMPQQDSNLKLDAVKINAESKTGSAKAVVVSDPGRASLESEPVLKAKREDASEKRFYIQIGEFKDRDSAERARKQSQKRYSDTFNKEVLFVKKKKISDGDLYYRVRGGPMTYARANNICRTIKKGDKKGCLVVGPGQ